MRYRFVILFLFLSCFIGSVHADLNQTIADVLATELGWGKNFSVRYVWSEGENYGIILHNSTETFMVKIVDQNVTVVLDNKTVESVLKSRRREGLTTVIDGIRADITLFNKSKTSERECKLSLGLDAGPCSDRDSCLKTCARSQYLCLPMAQGIGWPFVDEIVSFSKATLFMDVDLAEFSTALEDFASEKTNKLPKKALLQDIVMQIGEVTSNKLFAEYTGDGYEYCSEIPYRKDSVINAQNKLDELTSLFTSNDGIVVVQQSIINNTKEQLSIVWASRNAEKKLLEQIRTNASMEFARIYEKSKNTTEVVISPDVDNRITYINSTFEKIMLAKNSTEAYERYIVFKNSTYNLESKLKNLIISFDGLIDTNNKCSTALVLAESQVTSEENKKKLEQLNERKDRLDSLMGPPIVEANMGSIKTELKSITAQADLLGFQDNRADDVGIDYTFIGLALGAVIVIAVFGWLIKEKKVDIPGVGKSSPKQPEVGEKKETPVATPKYTKPTVSQHMGKLTMRGGAYRSSIRITVKDKDGQPVADGSHVMFSINEGLITPSTVTRNGVAYARMAFKKKPKGVDIKINAAGIERRAKIKF